MTLDQNHRFIMADTDVRGELTQLEQVLTEVNAHHQYPAAIQQLLGQICVAVSLLAARIKMEGSLVLQSYGDGPVRTLMAEINHLGQMRAIARYDDLPDTYDSLLGSGMLTITLIPKVGQQYQGTVSLQGDDLAKALEDYFLSSEQIKTRLWLQSDGKRAAGLLLQALPVSSEQASLSIDDDAFNRASTLADTLSAEEMLTLPAERLLYRLYHQEQVELFSPKALSFACSCSRARVESALLQMGEAEVRQIVAEEGEIKADCQFCYQQYRFFQQDVEQLFHSNTH